MYFTVQTSHNSCHGHHWIASIDNAAVNEQLFVQLVFNWCTELFFFSFLFKLTHVLFHRDLLHCKLYRPIGHLMG